MTGEILMDVVTTTSCPSKMSYGYDTSMKGCQMEPSICMDGCQIIVSAFVVVML